MAGRGPHICVLSSDSDGVPDSIAIFHGATQDDLARSHKVAASVIYDMVMEQSKEQSTGQNDKAPSLAPRALANYTGHYLFM